MNNIGTGLVPTVNSSPRTDLRLPEINTLDMDLEKIDKEIEKILEECRSHNTYRHFIRAVADSEKRIDDKKITTESKHNEIRQLKIGLILWKEYIGSEICMRLDAEISKQKNIFKGLFPLTDDVLEESFEFMRNGILDEARKGLEKKILLGMPTRGSIVFKPGKTVKDHPVELSQSWPKEKGTPKELTILIDMINLMILRLDVMAVRTIVATANRVGVTFEEIISTGQSSLGE